LKIRAKVYICIRFCVDFESISRGKQKNTTANRKCKKKLKNHPMNQVTFGVVFERKIDPGAEKGPHSHRFSSIQRCRPQNAKTSSAFSLTFRVVFGRKIAPDAKKDDLGSIFDSFGRSRLQGFLWIRFMTDFALIWAWFFMIWGCLFAHFCGDFEFL
jgi:hypothetical protein